MNPRTWTVQLPKGREFRRVLTEMRRLDGLMGITAEYDADDQVWIVTAPADDTAAGYSAESRLDYCAGRGATVTETTEPEPAPEPEPATPASQVAEMRAARSVREIAALIGCAISTVYRWLRGIHRPSARYATVIAAIA